MDHAAILLFTIAFELLVIQFTFALHLNVRARFYRRLGSFKIFGDVSRACGLCVIFLREFMVYVLFCPFFIEFLMPALLVAMFRPIFGRASKVCSSKPRLAFQSENSGCRQHRTAYYDIQIHLGISCFCCHGIIHVVMSSFILMIFGQCDRLPRTRRSPQILRAGRSQSPSASVPLPLSPSRFDALILTVDSS
jgi:hypothetical protein